MQPSLKPADASQLSICIYINIYTYYILQISIYNKICYRYMLCIISIVYFITYASFYIQQSIFARFILESYRTYYITCFK